MTGSENDTHRGALSWIGKVIKDGDDGNRRGIVREVTTVDDEPVLLVRFAGEGDTDRHVRLRYHRDGNYLDPDDPRTRYRPLSEREAAELDRRLA